MRVTAVVPAYNEEGKIGRVVKMLKDCGYVYAILAVNDGSQDRTAEVRNGDRPS